MSKQSGLLQNNLIRINIALSLHDFAGAILNPQGVYEALRAKDLDYYIWVAVKKVSDNWKKWVILAARIRCSERGSDRDGWAVAREECLKRSLHQLVSGSDRTIQDISTY